MLYFSGILECIKKIMSYGQMASSRECALLCIQLLSRPEDLVLWLKFGSQKLTVNSACTENFLVQYGNPQRIPSGRGFMGTDGAYFDVNDVIEVPGGVHCQEVVMEQWSVSFWVLLPVN